MNQAVAFDVTEAQLAGRGRAAPQRMAYGDPVRILGTVAVVVGHVCDMPLFSSHLAAPLSGDWWVCNVVDAAMRWAVPIYIMLSGALLLDPNRNEPAGVFYRKRLARLGVPLVFWTAFFTFFSIYYTGWCPGWKEAGLNLLKGQPYSHLHFIYRIAGLYAFTPMIRVFLRHADRPLVVGATVALLALSSLDSVANGLTGTDLSAFIRFVPFLGYYLCGYLLRETFVSDRQLPGCWLTVIVCIAILAGGTGLLVGQYGMKGYPSVSMLLYDFNSPVRIVYAVAAWLILVRMFHRPLAAQSGAWVGRWAAMTLGLYLLHPAIREVLHLHNFTAVRPNVWLGIPLVATMVYVPSLVLVWLIMRVPYLRRICG